MFKHLAAFFIIAVLFIGCSSKSEECVAPTIEKNLVGTWKAVIVEDGKATDTGEPNNKRIFKLNIYQ